ncbi:MAG: ADP-forming succinate--CoA ligase subunit beta [Candidatus Nezhaarchaeota archaeon]|nr:ADP-forming succinate--CoA ligase subunit beta [Candidatus Nezhaarchaeota archaeon]
MEYEAKNVLRSYGVPVPQGMVVTSVEEAYEAARKLKPPFMVKAQVPVSGRGKAGGILPANSPNEVKAIAERLLNTYIKGFHVKSLLIEEMLSIKRELYFGITVSRADQTYIVIASQEGGVDIEEVAEKSPEKVMTIRLDPWLGFQPHHARLAAKFMGYSGGALLSLENIFQSIYRAGMDYDAELIEVNPLAETVDGEFVALDARIIVDDNALFRHKELQERFLESLSPDEREAAKHDLAYVDLNGDLGVICNGAGLTMATIDVVHLLGGRPANFLDVGGGASPERIAIAVKMLLFNPKVKVILVNILGGITRCDEVAKGILDALKSADIKKPLVVRLVGTNEDQGRRMLSEFGILVVNDMEDAVRQAVEMVREG